MIRLSLMTRWIFRMKVRFLGTILVDSWNLFNLIRYWWPWRPNRIIVTTQRAPGKFCDQSLVALKWTLWTGMMVRFANGPIFP
jgi:hypothetical protein